MPYALCPSSQLLSPLLSVFVPRSCTPFLSQNRSVRRPRGRSLRSLAAMFGFFEVLLQCRELLGFGTGPKGRRLLTMCYHVPQAQRAQASLTFVSHGHLQSLLSPLSFILRYLAFRVDPAPLFFPSTLYTYTHTHGLFRDDPESMSRSHVPSFSVLCFQRSAS
ncbi:uncharacterized protein FOMMEDRAFT_158738 [Fomitiporia mediterranea MF3/22]|uniref:uncharacterized protein n=1 Tax=Fomitiporia mediterranea (strain MF3/22) TaxID=694068 RepID=UPI0004408610|nr:uncharacterized protein FOMMEDRAFT_158738 [Fomitiporia mediterranea MF3/22]EJD01585.1 hypothetical protein FOMMEDRAFT_158738 [Fomitiporia mediterranea MF3/22]